MTLTIRSLAQYEHPTQGRNIFCLNADGKVGASHGDCYFRRTLFTCFKFSHVSFLPADADEESALLGRKESFWVGLGLGKLRQWDRNKGVEPEIPRYKVTESPGTTITKP